MIADLKLNGCSSLKELACSSNKLQTLDLTDAVKLKYLYVYENELKSIDVTGCDKLDYDDEDEDYYNTEFDKGVTVIK